MISRRMRMIDARRVTRSIHRWLLSHLNRVVHYRPGKHIDTRRRETISRSGNINTGILRFVRLQTSVKNFYGRLCASCFSGLIEYNAAAPPKIGKCKLSAENPRVRVDSSITAPFAFCSRSPSSARVPSSRDSIPRVERCTHVEDEMHLSWALRGGQKPSNVERERIVSIELCVLTYPIRRTSKIASNQNVLIPLGRNFITPVTNCSNHYQCTERRDLRQSRKLGVSVIIWDF